MFNVSCGFFGGVYFFFVKFWMFELLILKLKILLIFVGMGILFVFVVMCVFRLVCEVYLGELGFFLKICFLN